MWGCSRPDRSIWALSRALALPISSLHGYFYCCVSNRDNTRTCTHTDTNMSLVKRVAGVRPLQGYVHYCCPGTQHFEIKTEIHYFFTEGSRPTGCTKACAMLSPVSSRKACQPYGLNAIEPQHIGNPHIPTHTHTH